MLVSTANGMPIPSPLPESRRSRWNHDILANPPAIPKMISPISLRARSPRSAKTFTRILAGDNEISLLDRKREI